ncbi:MAG: serine/threonine protein kinase [Spirochaetes bacterium]|nr:serine/threonine protein kinase [Spirochaetota bacterium]
MATEGTYVGKYLIQSKIAEGGMGAIYKAKHPTLGRTVILKRLTLKKNTAITERFKREAQLMIDFRHDNIVQVYDHFKEGNSYYIAMEYVDGISLGDLIEKKRYIPNDITMLIFREICKALKYAHDKSVIHRDIKPENVLISKDGEVKLTDFGIATSKDAEDDGLTSAGMTLGTPAYMSPEQISDTKTVDKRADIYSMGVVLYKMLTGKTPFPGNFTPDAISQINRGEYIYPRKINPRISPLLHRVIKKAMHHKAKKRYKDLHQIIDIFTKQLKRYKDKESINSSIKAYLQGKDATVNKTGKADTINAIGKSVKSVSASLASNFVRILLAVVFLLVLAAGGAYYAYMKGLHYEYLYGQEYGALSISITVPEKVKDPKDNYVDTALYVLQGKNYKSVKNIDFDFSLQEENNKSHFILQSNKVYLETGNYRIFIRFGNELFQKDFFLKPRIQQKVNKNSLESETIDVYYTRAVHLPLKVYYKIYDSITTNDISSNVDFEVFANRRWIAWKDFSDQKKSEDILVTGRTHRFRIKMDGYYTAYNKIYVQPQETVLYLETCLSPLPGAISIRSNAEDLEVLLNNSKNYLVGGMYKSYMKTEPTSGKRQTITLDPGSYFFTVRQSDDVTKTVKVNIESGKTSYVTIEYNKSKDSIDIEVKS